MTTLEIHEKLDRRGHIDLSCVISRKFIRNQNFKPISLDFSLRLLCKMIGVDLKICRYFYVSAHSQCTDQGYTVNAEVNAEASIKLVHLLKNTHKMNRQEHNLTI